jgi:hypothetical protein
MKGVEYGETHYEIEGQKNGKKVEVTLDPLGKHGTKEMVDLHFLMNGAIALANGARVKMSSPWTVRASPGRMSPKQGSA